jgi:hypothetical protein
MGPNLKDEAEGGTVTGNAGGKIYRSSENKDGKKEV